MMKLFLRSAMLLLATFIASCDFINPEEDAPSYIQVDKFDFDPDPTSTELGTSSSVKIKDVWVYVDNKFQGAYELPARFPVLETGVHIINLTPGIHLNGIAATRSPYPFYDGSIHQVTLEANGTTFIEPETHYFDIVRCAFCETFDDPGFALTSSPSSDTIMIQLPDGHPDEFEGTGSGAVYLDDVRSTFEVMATTAIPAGQLPAAGNPVYLELDYKINQQMVAGLYVTYSSGVSERIPIITLNPTETWNKVYVQLGYTVSAYSAVASGFKVFFGAVKDPGVAAPEFYLDNIKIVHFE